MVSSPAIGHGHGYHYVKQLSDKHDNEDNFTCANTQQTNQQPHQQRGKLNNTPCNVRNSKKVTPIAIRSCLMCAREKNVSPAERTLQTMIKLPVLAQLKQALEN